MLIPAGRLLEHDPHYCRKSTAFPGYPCPLSFQELNGPFHRAWPHLSQGDHQFNPRQLLGAGFPQRGGGRPQAFFSSD
jgi:hypothetical protein